ncbi:carboxymuconolactone decarboxylase family protein [Thalassospira mesophila]|uniref:Alkylhydroperoxidase n=1 Tax=Thalassospira mesophila TaxID=1293891 RepID=A0A1Y2L1Q4_9PROT|nr:carboxymuconolactone decarboxylase family protein [Thalassospira mesophila]OSQ39409.1 alkylhydroperoxidase [Thalassospira mesophila]
MSRFDFAKTSPALFKGLYHASTVFETEKTVPKTVVEIVKCRVSQLNACSFCLRMHRDDYLKHGGQQDKIDMLAVWRNAKDFDASERAALDWAEKLTIAADSAAIDASFEALGAHFSESQISELTTGIALINAWNRLGIAQHQRA